jgi:uncharacterized membrane protein YtjA (UPF0391 family)
MLYYALVFLFVGGVIAAAMNFTGVSPIMIVARISWILFLTGVVLIPILVVTRRTTRIA